MEYLNEIWYLITDNTEHFLFVVVLLLVIRLVLKSRIKFLHSNWNHLIDDFNFSTKEFYELLEKELKECGIDNVKFSTVNHQESHVFSSSRKYLRIRWKRLTYDVCAAPFGKGFFISWWLFETRSFIVILIATIPIVGNWLARLFHRVTYYTYDTSSMFQAYAHQSVLKVMEEITKESGVRALTDDEKKPTLKDPFKR